MIDGRDLIKDIRQSTSSSQAPPNTLKAIILPLHQMLPLVTQIYTWAWVEEWVSVAMTEQKIKVGEVVKIDKMEEGAVKVEEGFKRIKTEE